MDFKSSPLGGLYASLRQAASPKEGQNLDQCELRADSKSEGDLRVKTGARSGWSSKARKAHQTNAIQIVRAYFHRSVSALIDNRKGLTESEKSVIRDAGSRAWQEEARSREFLTVGMLKPLHTRVVGVFNANLPEQRLSAQSFASLPPQPKLGAVPASPAAIHSSPPDSSSVLVHASPSGGSCGTQVAALTTLKAQYPLEKFPSSHGEYDAESSQNKRNAFHAKLEMLVEIAGGHQPRVVNQKAQEGGFQTLGAAAKAMKVNPGMHPAAALYLQLHGSAANTIYKAYPQEVDAHLSQLTQMSRSEMPEMRKQAGKPE